MVTRSLVAVVLFGAACAGAAVGIGSARRASPVSAVPLVTVADTRTGSHDIVDRVAAPAADMGIVRVRAPQPGDQWSGCNDARAAGTAPIYRGEPGYRSGMDGDGDGIACEPYRS